MPVWLQIVLPVFTAVLGFGLGRLSKALDRRQERKDEQALQAKAEEARKPRFVVEHVRGELYRLVNVGERDASGVYFDDKDESFTQIGGRPERIQLGVRAAHEFNICVTDQFQMPSRVLIICDQFDEPEPASIPL
ncbi:hypothetical protein [Amycolatopsis sp. lyj-23]|uniref:hypothetical protein n=1 Tax=Amycolatopsis sp. lyj-23 TaxID=2789283 RepID=UPI003979361E